MTPRSPALLAAAAALTLFGCTGLVPDRPDLDRPGRPAARPLVQAGWQQ